MIYTCYEMIRDCRADRPQGWSYFIANYTPVMQRVIAHYFPQHAADSALAARLLADLRRPESSLFQSLEPAPERWFVAELRQQVLAAIQPGNETVPAILLDLETLAAALEPFTVVEKQAAWLEAMRYTPAHTGVLLRMEPRTVETIRARAAGLLRGKADAWNQTVIADNGFQLGRAAAAAQTPECPPAKTFLDVLDGRASWRGRELLERHVTACWHCVDHFCRMAEVIDLLRGLQPLPEPERDRFCEALGIPLKRRRAWRKWFGASE